MKTQLLKLPFGCIQVLLNGRPISFEYQNSSYDTYYNEKDEAIKVLGAIELIVDTEVLKPGDILYFYSLAGKLENDGGDEGTVNAVAELTEYTYGMGGPDTEFIEWQYGSIPGDMPDSSRFGYTHHVLDCELYAITEYGIQYRIVKPIDKSKCGNGRLYVSVVWENNSKPYAYNIVSLLTC